MATSQAILNDVDLRYRNTFTTEQKLEWFNEEQRELFDILELDSDPYAFTTVAGENYYPIPDGLDIEKIKVVTYQNQDTPEPNFDEIHFYRNDDYKNAPYGGTWFTAVSDAFYLYVGGGVPDGRIVYIYCDSDPTEVTTSNLNLPPDLPTRYHEILKLGILKRIAMARKDVVFQNNYDADRELKIMEIMWQKRLKEPEWVTPADVMPRVSNNFPWPNGWPSWRPNGW